MSLKFILNRIFCLFHVLIKSSIYMIPFFQMTGLSGAGKSAIANMVRNRLLALKKNVEIIDGDVYRKSLCSDLGFSGEDRIENIRRLGFVASILARNNVIVIIAAINPYEIARIENKDRYDSRLIYVRCGIEILIQRDTKGLYQRATLPDNHPDKIHNLTGVNDVFEIPQSPDLILDTDIERVDDSVQKLVDFVLENISK